MKLWKKPLMLVQTMEEVTKFIQVNAATCINRFVR